MRFLKFLFLLLVLLGGTVGCDIFGSASPVEGLRSKSSLRDSIPLADIDSLSRDNETKIYVEGTVANVAPFLGSGAYELADETGSTWVLTEENLPKIGEQVSIEGQVTYRSISVEEQELGESYLIEIVRRQTTDSAE